MTFIEICKNDENIDPECWKNWIKSIDNIQNKSIYYLLGINKEEYQDLINKKRTMTFFKFKYSYTRNINKLWSGCYVKFVYENDCARNPHFEQGWIDVIDEKNKICKVQCDDSFNGMRALVLRINDIMQILPYKERPLIYYKTMICGNCNECDRASNQINQQICPHFYFFNALLNKQKNDQIFIQSYMKIKEQNHNINPNQINQHECHHCNDDKCNCKDCS